jgi:hypothetical protein
MSDLLLTYTITLNCGRDGTYEYAIDSDLNLWIADKFLRFTQDELFNKEGHVAADWEYNLVPDWSVARIVTDKTPMHDHIVAALRFMYEL